MKIVDRETFLAMPAGTVFTKFDPYYFGSIGIKGDSIGNDFWYQDFPEVKCFDGAEFMEVLERGSIEGTSIDLDFDCQGRDGLFIEKQQFAVFERHDVVNLIESFRAALESYPNEN